jgi:tetraacyldisaccharide 4'-kinase
VKDRLRAKPKRLGWPVVSVGSVSAGGAGKTPVVIALAKMLSGRGWDVDVLSRGYGRSGSGVECVSSQTEGATARYGDEPVMMARAAGVPVWVAADRFAAGMRAESSGGEEKGRTRRAPRKGAEDATAAVQGHRVHLLDDGFQHQQLARDFDVVLVTAEDLDDVLLPAGNLREPLSALRRADAVVVREDELDDVKARVWEMMLEGAQMWVVRRKLHFPAPLFVFGAGLRPVAFCAIARPEGFQAMLAEAGCGVVETVAFDDHHAYAISDVDRIVEVGRGLQATGFVTTEKDAVKLTAGMRARLEAVGPVMVVALEAEFADEDAVIRALEGRLRAGRT